jgi:hypothetical protein
MAKDKMDPFEFDSRMVEWYIKHNVITKDQLQAHLKTLTDSQANAIQIELDDEPTTSNGAYTGEGFPTQA